MQTKPKGVVHRGSVKHQLLTELERYPDSWYQWFQFPDVNASMETIKRTISRLMEEGKVESRMTLNDTGRDNMKRETREIKLKKPDDA